MYSPLEGIISYIPTDNNIRKRLKRIIMYNLQICSERTSIINSSHNSTI